MEMPHYLGRPFSEDTSIFPDSQPFKDMDDGRAFAQAIMDTIREPLLVLDKDLRVVTANRSFYLTFRMNRQDVQGHLVYALGGGEWDIPELRFLLVWTMNPLGTTVSVTHATFASRPPAA